MIGSVLIQQIGHTMQIIYPPRPKSRILANELPAYEKTGKWVVQRKFNGTRVLIHVYNREVYLLNRHGQIPKQFVLTSPMRSEILSLDFSANTEYWLDGEILDAKTKSEDYKNKIVLFDVLQAGKYLFGSPNLIGRLALLNSICRLPSQLEPKLGIALLASKNVWMAQTFFDQFSFHFNEFISSSEIEGLVLKRKDSTLDNFGKKEYEVGWQIRCRKSSVNYQF